MHQSFFLVLDARLSRWLCKFASNYRIDPHHSFTYAYAIHHVAWESKNVELIIYASTLLIWIRCGAWTEVVNHSSAPFIQVSYSAIGDWMRQYSVRL